MAYVAMNIEDAKKWVETWFLNGVCRHELWLFTVLHLFNFLNGVCRHERPKEITKINRFFLNGVCRHEPMQALLINS